MDLEKRDKLTSWVGRYWKNITITLLIVILAVALLNLQELGTKNSMLESKLETEQTRDWTLEDYQEEMFKELFEILPGVLLVLSIGLAAGFAFHGFALVKVNSRTVERPYWWED